MTRLRIVFGTFALATTALVADACSLTGRCGGECGCVAEAPATSGGVVATPVAAIPAATLVVAVSAAPPPAPPSSALPALDASADAAAAAVVHNYKRLSPKIARGAAPEGDAAFAALAAAGIKSIVTVDGAAPDVAAAKRHGIRYVHIPFGYDGVPEATALELAKTFEQLAPAGPIFVHCHHGKHRGPAGCEIARIVLDGISNDDAIADMKLAGTDPKYSGLYASIRTFRKPSPEALASVKADMPELAPAGTRAAAMVSIDQGWDRLKSVRSATWVVPKDHADVDPSHEAVILAEGFREFARRPEVAGEAEAFRSLLSKAEAAAWELSKALEMDHLDAGKAEAAFTATQTACAACHTQFRDNSHR